MFHSKVVKKIKTHSLYSITFFFFENRAVYEIRWRNTARWATFHITTRCMGFAYSIPKATNIHSEYDTYCFSRQKVLDERTSKLRLHVHCLSSLDMGFIAVYSENCMKILKLEMQYPFIMARKKCFKSDVCPKDIKSGKITLSKLNF